MQSARRGEAHRKGVTGVETLHKSIAKKSPESQGGGGQIMGSR